MPTFDTPRPITAHIEVAAGSVRLIASERSDTVVDVLPHDTARPADVKASHDALIDFTNGTLRVSTHRRAIVTRDAVAVVVQLPSRSALRGSVASATVAAEGQLGDCRVDSAGGNVDLDETAACKISTSSGAVTVQSVDGAAVVATASGDVEIGTLRGHLKATTASGEITVGVAAQGALKLATASGDIHVGIPEGTAAHLKLQTGKGSVRNGLSVSADGPGDADQTLTVHAETSSGDIDVHRS